MSDIEAIAKSLTKAELGALVLGKWNVGSHCRKLIEVGAVRRTEKPYQVELTPLGLEVRAYLEGAKP